MSVLGAQHNTAACMPSIMRQRMRTYIATHGGETALPDVLCAHEARAMLGCSKTVFSLWWAANRLPGAQFKPKGLWRCSRAAWLVWIATDAYWEPEH